MTVCVHGVSGGCSAARTDGWMDGWVDRRSAVRAKVTTEPAGRAARHKQETGWWRGSDTWSCRWQERWQGMTHTSMPLLSPRGRRGHGHSARPPTTQHPVGSILPRSQLSSVTSPPATTRGCRLTRDIDGDHVGLHRAGLVPLLLLHGGQGEGPGPGCLLVGGGGEAQGGVGWSHAQRAGTAALLLIGSPARGLRGKARITPVGQKGPPSTLLCNAVPMCHPQLMSCHPTERSGTKVHPHCSPGLTISTNSRRLEGGGRGEGSVGVLGDGWPAARKVCPVTLLSAYCSSYSSARETDSRTPLRPPMSVPGLRLAVLLEMQEGECRALQRGQGWESCSSQGAASLAGDGQRSPSPVL